MSPSIPHLRVIIGACIAAVTGYAIFSAYAVIWLRDATMTGDVIGTWKSFAVAAFAFWLGSSSGGKAKTETPTEPQPVIVTNDTTTPVPVEPNP